MYVLCALFLKLGTVADCNIIKLKMLIAVCMMNADDTSYNLGILFQRVRLKSI